MLFVIAFFALPNVHAQTNTPSDRLLSSSEVGQLFPETVKKQFNITFPIFKVFSYTDNTGVNYLLLTESLDAQAGAQDSIHHKIRAVCLKASDNQFTKNWEINDLIATENEESSIWFRSKLCSVKDLDGDGLADPIVAYGSTGLNGTNDGRSKFIIVYKGQKIAVRHQGSEMDGGRNTSIDKAFYSLPKKIQLQVRAGMKRLEQNQETIFSDNWEKAMDQQKTYID